MRRRPAWDHPSAFWKRERADLDAAWDRAIREEDDDMRQIKQIIPAQPMFNACYRVEGEIRLEPVAMWALIEAYGDTFVAGMEPSGEGDLMFCDESDNFLGYILAGANVPDWMKE